VYPVIVKTCVDVVNKDKVRCKLRQNVSAFQLDEKHGVDSEPVLGAGDPELDDGAVGTSCGLNGTMSAGKCCQQIV